MKNPNEMSIEELQDFIDNFPQNSACDRAYKERLKQLLVSKQQLTEVA